jgi:hypothetical protein
VCHYSDRQRAARGLHGTPKLTCEYCGGEFWRKGGRPSPVLFAGLLQLVVEEALSVWLVRTTHYRRLRSGQDMDAPIRRYARYDEGADDKRNPVTAKTIRRKREKPFAAEYALLAELGLRRNCVAQQSQTLASRRAAP